MGNLSRRGLLLLGATLLGCGTPPRETSSREDPPPPSRLLVFVSAEVHHLSGTILVIGEDLVLDASKDARDRDESGNVEFRDLAPGPKWVLFISQLNHAPAATRVLLAPGATRRITFSPHPARIIRGHVVDGDGNPVEKALVEFTIPGVIPVEPGEGRPERVHYIIGGGGGRYGGRAGGRSWKAASYTWGLTSDGRYTFKSTTVKDGSFFLPGVSGPTVEVTVRHGETTLKRKLKIGEEPTITLPAP